MSYVEVARRFVPGCKNATLEEIVGILLEGQLTLQEELYRRAEAGK